MNKIYEMKHDTSASNLLDHCIAQDSNIFDSTFYNITSLESKQKK